LNKTKCINIYIESGVFVKYGTRNSFTDMTNFSLLFKTGLEREQFKILLSFLKEGDIHIRDKSLYLGLY